MTLLLMIVITMFSAVFQSLLPSLPFLGGARAPVVLGAVMYYALTRERGMVLLVGLLAGIFEDALVVIPSSTCWLDFTSTSIGKSSSGITG
jgi:uncharacterized membrane protein